MLSLPALLFRAPKEVPHGQQSAETPIGYIRFISRRMTFDQFTTTSLLLVRSQFAR